MKPKTVLVVDDDTLINEALSEGLKAAGFKILNAGNGEEGLKLALQHKPDLILLDLMMPIKNGHEMLDELRTDKWGSSVPVTVLTNATDNIDIFKVKKYPRTNYAIKSDMKLGSIVEMAKERLNAES